jgi:hypothetical protein
MKASKIITLGLVAASAGLIMGTVALPAQAASMDRVVNAQRPNRPDSGKHGNFWARNYLHRQIKITESAPGVYKVTVRDNGKFSNPDRLGRHWLSHLPPAYDYDCRGGSGDGPKYTGPVRVTGSDPYHLDRNRNGKGCERS